MSEHHWYKLRKRLDNIIQIKLDNEIIWAFPKNTNQNIDQGFIHG